MNRIALLAFSLALISGCVSSGPHSASGQAIEPDTIRRAEMEVARRQIRPELREYFFSLYAEGRPNSTLHAMRGGLGAIRLGEWTLAKQTLDQAIHEVEALQEGAKQAERTKSNFIGEREKWFKGESYERSALYFYRGLLYLKEGDAGNAAACFKRSQIQDLTGDDAKNFSGDWYSDELALALASWRKNDSSTADQALARATSFSSKQGVVPPPQPENNLLVVVEVGRAPIKYSGGKFNELLKFREEAPGIQRIRVKSSPEIVSAPAENLFFQATTRGTRKVDAILGEKASFKEDTGNATIGLAGGAVAASQVDKSGISSGILALAAIGTGIASASTRAEADTRTWDNLPHSVYLLGLTVPSGTAELLIQGERSDGAVIQTQTIPADQLPKTTKELNVVFLRF